MMHSIPRRLAVVIALALPAFMHGPRASAQDGAAALPKRVRPIPTTTPANLATAVPTRVTLRHRAARPKDVVEDLARQAGVPIRVFGAGDGWGAAGLHPVTIDADQRPFLEVFRDVCRQAALEPASYARDTRTIWLNPRQAMLERRGRSAERDVWIDSPAVVSGPLMFAATEVHTSSTLHLGPNAPQPPRGTWVHFNVMADPNIDVRGASGTLLLDEAVDEQGNSLLPAVARRRVEQPLNPISQGAVAWKATAQIELSAARGSKRIARLRGSTRIQVVTKTQTLDVPDVLYAQDTEHKQLPGVRCRIATVQARDHRYYAIEFVVHRDDVEQKPWGQLHTLLSTERGIELLDGAGNPLRQISREAGKGSWLNELRYTFHFTRVYEDNQVVGEPARLIWEVPTQVNEVAVPVEFTDIPLVAAPVPVEKQ